MFAIATTLAALSMAASPVPAAGPAQGPVRLELNNGGDYQPGDQVKAKVEVDDDGYLVVFRVDGDGYIRVLFPLDPDLDAFVRGGHRYELRGRGDHESFLADDRGGTGLVLAALSREPLDVGQFATGTHWDYERLRLDDPAGDAEAQLLAIVRQMTDNGRFDYDVVGYRVWGPGYESTAPTIVAGGGWDPYWDAGRFSCLACGWGYGRSGFGITIGANPWDPWYSPWSDPWYYGYNPYRYNYGWNGFWGWDGYWGTPYRPITVINTYPRPTVPNPVYGNRSRPRQPVGSGATPRLSDPIVRPQPRPTIDQPRSRRPNESGSTSRPAPRPSGTPQASPSRGSTATPSAPSSGSSSRSRSRRPDELSLPIVRPSMETRRTEARPVYRPPVQATPSREAPRVSPESRPASSPPPRQATPTRVERSTQRAMPQSSPRATPSPSRMPTPQASPSRMPTPRAIPSSPPSAGRSAPAPSRGSSAPRSRGRPDN